MSSWLALYRKQKESMQFIQAFLKSSEKVNTAISMVAVPASPDRAAGPAARAAGGLLAGQSCCPQVSCTALQPQCSSPAGHVSTFSRSPFVSLSPGCQEEAQRIRFLEIICTLCKAARRQGLSQGLNAFCHRFELAENIKVRGHPAGLGRGARSLGTGTL